MPAPFKQITREQFAELLARFEFRRKVNAVHMHHTWRPNHSQYDPADGHKAILGMFLHHTKKNGWQDIAQHITVAPDGTLWLGRNWNLPPASAAGHNGNAAAGPFMVEIIGDFDHGRDRFEGEQRDAVLDVIARVQKRFGLPAESLKFHNAMSAKSCPGTTVDYDEIVARVREGQAALAQEAPRAAAPAPGPFGPDAREVDAAIEEALDALGRGVPRALDPADAEPTYEDDEREVLPAPARQARESGVSPEMLARLRPHLVNLNLGKFSTDGKWKTARGDVDAIFEQHLEAALAEAERAGEPLRILFFAHGGLVKESQGLEIAAKHVEFWKRNRIYPIYFIWETGFFETIGQLLRRAQEGTRNLFSDHVSDPLIESLARALQGPRIWGAMKFSAEQAVAAPDSPGGEGGARYVAAQLKAFCDKNAAKRIELHAVGHSAGSIFHAHFLSAARGLGAPSFKSAHFLAPAIRVDAFKALLGGSVGPGKGIDHLSLFTMTEDYERDDTCAELYRKSLLYLIHYALEPEVEASILGLEQSLRDDAELRALFGLTATRAAAAEVIFAVSPIDKGRSASTSRTHGGFDDDAPTMNSVARRVLGKADADAIAEYVVARGGARALGLWRDQVDWPARVNEPGRPAVLGAAMPAFTIPAAAVPGLGLPAELASSPVRGASAGARRRALCIGINEYATAPLAGCVADAEEWVRIFSHLGFETTILRNGQATRAAIVTGLSELIQSSKPGDVIAIQFAGHGTQLPDLDGDEADGDTPGNDEALCPYDFADGAFLIDDDVRNLFAAIPDGVNVTCFFDCCHSGTNTRFAVGLSAGSGTMAGDQRKRFIPATEQMKAAHRAFREKMPATRTMRGGQDLMRNIAFSACLSSEVAWESNGHGDFTLRATRLLANGSDDMTNEQFAERVVAEFGAGARQRPMLDCAPAARTLPLLQSLIRAGGAVSSAAAAPAGDSPTTVKHETIQALQALIQKLQAL